MPVKSPVKSIKSAQSARTGPPEAVRTIKKYPNRRLYDTETSGYITLAEIKKLVMAAEPLVVLAGVL